MSPASDTHETRDTVGSVATRENGENDVFSSPKEGED